MVYKEDYKIGEDGFMFSTYTFKKYCESKNIELDELIDNISAGEAFKSKELPGLLEAAHQTWCLYNKIPFEADELKVCHWIDQIGGYNSMGVVELYKVFVCKLLNIEAGKFDVMIEEVQGQDPKNVNGQGVAANV